MYLVRAGGQSAAEAAGHSEADVLAGIYIGPKAALRPIHDALMDAIRPFGPFEVAPKKGYVSLRRKKQFALLTPATKSRYEIGINLKGQQEEGVLKMEKPNAMCSHRIELSGEGDLNEDIYGWLKKAYEHAG